MSGDLAKPIHSVSVRDLVEFVLRQGDLGGEREFVGSDRALAGIRGHQKIQRSRPTGYLTELPVEHRMEAEEFTLQIRGRIDGLLITSENVLLEEIKTVSGSWDRQADLLHWAQAKFYGFMHAREAGLKEFVIQLVYLSFPTIQRVRQTRLPLQRPQEPAPARALPQGELCLSRPFHLAIRLPQSGQRNPGRTGQLQALPQTDG